MTRIFENFIVGAQVRFLCLRQKLLIFIFRIITRSGIVPLRKLCLSQLFQGKLGLGTMFLLVALALGQGHFVGCRYSFFWDKNSLQGNDAPSLKFGLLMKKSDVPFFGSGTLMRSDSLSSGSSLRMYAGALLWWQTNSSKNSFFLWREYHKLSSLTFRYTVILEDENRCIDLSHVCQHFEHLHIKMQFSSQHIKTSIRNIFCFI